MIKNQLGFVIILLVGIYTSVSSVAQISGPTSCTVNNTYTYSYYSSTYLAYANWQGGGTIVSTWESVGGSGGTYYVSVKWTSAGTKNLTIANYSEPLATISVDVCSSGQAAGVSLPSYASICAVSTVQFTASPTNGGTSPSYVWKVNGVTKQSGSSATYSTSQLVLNDVVSVAMTSSITCVSPRTTSASTTVTNVTQPGTVSISINDPGSVCSTTGLTFTASVTNGGSGPTYTWYRNGNVVDDNELSGNSSTYDPYYGLQDGCK